MDRRALPDTAARDRAVRRVRAVSWATGIAAAVSTAVLSAAAAHAFKGHDGRKRAHTAAPPATTPAPRPHRRVQVPPPDQIESLNGAPPAPPQPPPQAPSAAPSAPAAPSAAAPPPPPPPVSSGGS